MQAMTNRRSLKEKQRQEREDLILQAAEAVIMEKGYLDTSMDEIAARVGISKGTVYLHFASKDDLIFALFQRDMQKFMEIVEEVASSESAPRAKLETILQYMYGELFSRRFQMIHRIYNSPESQKMFNEQKKAHGDGWEKLVKQITSLLDEGKVAGEFDETIPTTVMLSVFLNLLSLKGYERMVVEGKMSSEDLMKHLTHLYFNGIAAR